MKMKRAGCGGAKNVDNGRVLRLARNENEDDHRRADGDDK